MKYLALIGGIFFLLSCKKEQQPEMSTVNAGCDCSHEVSADFVMEELTTPNPNFVKYTSTDTIFADKNVRFRALENDAHYTWIIGAEILNGQEVTRYFGPELEGQVIPIKLIVKKDANNICFPGDDGIDTITKFLVIGPGVDIEAFYNESNRYEGTFRVKGNNVLDSIDISIEILGQVDMSPNQIAIHNWDGLGGTIYGELFGINYREAFLDLIMHYDDSSVKFKLDGKFELNFISPLSENTSYKYFGRKLN